MGNDKGITVVTICSRSRKNNKPKVYSFIDTEGVVAASKPARRSASSQPDSKPKSGSVCPQCGGKKLPFYKLCKSCNTALKN